MNALEAITLGVVEGITEFLPISSTFHLIFTARVLGINQNDFIKLFEVFIQSGAILSVALLYFKDVVKDKKILKMVFVSFLPTALIGLFLYKFIKNILFESEILLVAIFLIVGGIFIILERLVQRKTLKLEKQVKSLDYKQALIIGLFQSLAIIPGVSRAGAVIVGMIVLKYKRDSAAYYSFLLSIPTILAAAFFDLFKTRQVVSIEAENFFVLLLGFISAFISSYLVIRWFIAYLKRNTLVVFGIYRFVVGIILLLVLSK
ncbi:undecaprenyl-diphosphate phosphatase [Candidatus Roizmanbacteria bacterium]|nr:undecaprenyl-diphosphate phosphatase [Candidatus Roizmanbacteria bacterium]